MKRTAAQGKAGQRGHIAEWLAAGFLFVKGYRILSRRYGGKGGEIDIIAKRGRTIIFVEVKARAAMQDATQAISRDKARLVSQRVRQWLANNDWAVDCTLRADAVFIAPGHMPRHVTQVFEITI